MENINTNFRPAAHVVRVSPRKLDRVLDLLEKAGIASPLQTAKPSADSCMRRGLPDNRQVTFDPLPRGQGSE